MRKQQYASVLPYLEIWLGTNNKDQLFDLRLLNNGIGPAFIEEIRIVHNGQVYPGDPLSFYRTKIIQEDTIRMGFYNITKGCQGTLPQAQVSRRTAIAKTYAKGGKE